MNGLHKRQLVSPESRARILQQLVRLCCLRKSLMICIVVALAGGEVRAQSESDGSLQLSDLALSHTYAQKRASSYDRPGGDDDFVKTFSARGRILAITPFGTSGLEPRPRSLTCRQPLFRVPISSRFVYPFY
jgi:hypothetical protein